MFPKNKSLLIDKYVLYVFYLLMMVCKIIIFCVRRYLFTLEKWIKKKTRYNIYTFVDYCTVCTNEKNVLSGGFYLFCHWYSLCTRNNSPCTIWYTYLYSENDSIHKNRYDYVVHRLLLWSHQKEEIYIYLFYHDPTEELIKNRF